MADTATTPPASPTDTIIPAATSGHDNVGKKSPQPADKPKTAPTVQKDNPAPKLRQDYPSRKAGKREQQFRSQPDGNSRRKQFQPSTRAPAFVDFPVVIHDVGGGSARFDKLGPWHRSQLLSNAVGAVRSIRPLPSGKWLIGCATEAQQSKLARLDSRFVSGIVVPSTPTLINLYNMCQDISLKSCVCSPWPVPRVTCTDWKGITTRQSSVRSLRGTRSWPAYTSETTSSLATNRSSQVLPTGIPAE